MSRHHCKRMQCDISNRKAVMSIEFIDPPELPQHKFRIRNFVNELVKTPNKWAVYRRVEHDDYRRATVNCYSAIDHHRRRYPEIRWEAVKDDRGWYIAAIYEQGEANA